MWHPALAYFTDAWMKTSRMQVHIKIAIQDRAYVTPVERRMREEGVILPFVL